jgi:hypothetical protein
MTKIRESVRCVRCNLHSIVVDDAASNKMIIMHPKPLRLSFIFCIMNRTSQAARGVLILIDVRIEILACSGWCLYTHDIN